MFFLYFFPFHTHLCLIATFINLAIFYFSTQAPTFIYVQLYALQVHLIEFHV